MLPTTLNSSVSTIAIASARGIDTYKRLCPGATAQSPPGAFSAIVPKVLVAPAIDTSGSTTARVESLFIKTTK